MYAGGCLAESLCASVRLFHPCILHQHFEFRCHQLAEKRWGVIGLLWRPVACDHVPAKRASTSTPSPGQEPGPDWDGVDRRPWP